MNSVLAFLGMAAFAVQRNWDALSPSIIGVFGYVEKAVYAIAVLAGIVCLFIPSKRRIVGIILLAITIVLFGMTLFVISSTAYSAGTLLSQAIFSGIVSIVLLILGRKSA